MSEDYKSTDVVCPFYRNSDNNSISCESIMSNSAGIKITFMNRAIRDRFMDGNCCSDYQKCLIAQDCEKKYK